MRHFLRLMPFYALATGACIGPRYAGEVAPVIAPLANTRLACSGLEAALDSIGKLTSGTGSVLAVSTRLRRFDEEHTILRGVRAMQDLPGLLASTWQGFLDQNRLDTAGCNSFVKASSIVPAPSEVDESRDLEGSWVVLARLIPSARGLVEVSAPGIDKRGTQMLIRLTVTRSPRAGLRYLVILDRQASGEWHLSHLATEEMSE